MTDGVKLGQKATTLPSDTTANRPGTPSAGDIRFNTTTNYMEYYDGTSWQSIASPPLITSISPTYYGASGETITLSGSFFSSSPSVVFISKTGTSYNAAVTTFVNSSSVTATIPSGMDSDNNDPFDVKIVNSSGLSYLYPAALSRTSAITFSTASGSIGTIYDSKRSGYSLSAVTATAAEGDLTLTYSVTSGSLPTGLSLASNGTISGTASSVVSDTTYNFTVTATGTDSSNSGQGTQTASRAFSITIKAPVVVSYTTTGTGTFSVPSGISSVAVLIVAGGGAGGTGSGPGSSAGGGGAGGLIYNATYPVTPGGTVSYQVGAGANAQTSSNTVGGNGTPSYFGPSIAVGGGGGGASQGNSPPGQPGGSGGGGGTQPPQGPIPNYGTGTPGQGNRGGWSAQGPGSDMGGGGGGAGAVGQDALQNTYGGSGGIGLAYSISGSPVYYAGGGSGGWQNGGSTAGVQGGGGASYTGSAVPAAGTANRGGGGGGSSSTYSTSGAGGSGIVIVSY